MGDATWGGKAIPLGKRAFWTGGRLASVASWGEGDFFWSRTKWGWMGGGEAKRTRQENENMVYCAVPPSVYSVHHDSSSATAQTTLGRGSHVPIQRAQPPLETPGLGYHQAMLTLPRR